MSPPRDAAALASLLAVAGEIVRAPDTATAAAVLADWCHNAIATAPTPATFTDLAPAGTGLQPVIDAVLRRSGRAHSVLVRSLDQLDGQQRLRVTDFDVDDIPQLIWPCALTTALRAARRPGQDMIRVAVSLTMARIAGARSWAQAAEALGWTAAQGSQRTRYVFRGDHGDLRRQVIDAALELAPLIAQQPERHRWVRRPTTVGSTRRHLEAAQRPDCRQQGSESGWCPCQRAGRVARTRQR